MKVLIVYATRTGSAAKAAELLAGYFSDVRVSNLENENIMTLRKDEEKRV